MADDEFTGVRIARMREAWGECLVGHHDWPDDWEEKIRPVYIYERHGYYDRRIRYQSCRTCGTRRERVLWKEEVE